MTRAALTYPLMRPLLWLPGLAVAVALAGIAALVMMPAPQAVAAVVTPAVAPPLASAASGRGRSCEACGLIETIRRTDLATGLSSYEFTVRMRDGSTRASSQATRGRWSEGDRVVVIGGTAARALEQRKAAVL